uniref:MYND-type domain-containing protein n=1 Tax=Schistocephalus solidus TaxID=70667 RepID=A0A0X3NTN0_SCHSO
MEDDPEFFAQCSYCARVLPKKNCLTCESCHALVYCSQYCRTQDFSNTLISDHAHSKWCSLLSVFMNRSNCVTEFPFTFSDQTTCETFSSGKLFQFLRLYGIYNLGLWKYLFHTSGSGPVLNVSLNRTVRCTYIQNLNLVLCTRYRH